MTDIMTRQEAVEVAERLNGQDGFLVYEAVHAVDGSYVRILSGTEYYDCTVGTYSATPTAPAGKVTESVEIEPAHTVRRAVLTWKGEDVRDWPEAELADAQSEARRWRERFDTIGQGADVGLKWRTVQVAAAVVSPLDYAYWLEGLQEDEADEHKYAALVSIYGEPDWALIEDRQVA